MSLTPEEFQEIIDEEEWSPVMRAALEQQKASATRRAKQVNQIRESVRRQALTYRWQQETLRELQRVFAECSEVKWWMSRARSPMQATEIANRLNQKLRGMNARISRARREGSMGCKQQIQWLMDHAELINEVENYRAAAQAQGLQKDAASIRLDVNA